MNFKGKKLMLAGVIGVAAVVGLTGCGGPNKQFINIGTGGTAGTYYPLGGAIAEILNKDIPGISASAQSTGGSVANINMIKKGELQMAIVQNDITYYAAEGKEMFKGKPVKNLKGLAALYPETIQIVTLGDSSINSIEDLKGKRVAVGAPGSGAEANARQILEAYGITYNDINAQYLSFGEAASALKDHNVDAAFVTAGAPTAAVQDIAASNSVKLISLSPEKVEALIKKYPYYAKMVIPADVYTNYHKATNTVAVKAILVVSDKVSDELGEKMAKAIYSNLDKIKAAHSVGKFITVDTATEAMPIPLNAGAKKFYDSLKKK